MLIYKSYLVAVTVRPRMHVDAVRVYTPARKLAVISSHLSAMNDVNGATLSTVSSTIRSDSAVLSPLLHPPSLSVAREFPIALVSEPLARAPARSTIVSECKIGLRIARSSRANETVADSSSHQDGTCPRWLARTCTSIRVLYGTWL